MKMRITASRGAPMVRRIAMSRVLARTSMMSEEMMLKAATSTISDRITNIATRSTDSASNKLLFIDRQSEITACAATFSASGCNISPTLSGSVVLISIIPT